MNDESKKTITINLTYAFLYGLTPAEFLTLLTPAQLWGIPYI